VLFLLINIGVKYWNELWLRSLPVNRVLWVGGFADLARVCTEFMVLHLLGNNDSDKTLVYWINFCNKHCSKQEVCNYERFPNQLVSILVTLFTACGHTRLPHTVTGIIFHSNSLLYFLQILSQLSSIPSCYLHIHEMFVFTIIHRFGVNAAKLLQMECYFWFLSFLEVSIFCCCGISEDAANNILTRKRRYLAFPEGSTFVVSRTVIIRQVITHSYCFNLALMCPWIVNVFLHV
jgi:hypothetical protein